MSRKGTLTYVFTFVTLTYVFTFVILLVHTSEHDSTMTRDLALDDVIKVNGYPYTENAAYSTVHCASLCLSERQCSSFFFLPATGRCLLHEFVFASPVGGQWSLGARYFKVEAADCPSHDGYVWIRGHHLCIKIYSGPTTFVYANGNCTSDGARLAVVDTGDKLKAVSAYMADIMVRRALIGAGREGAANGTRTTWDKTRHPLYWLNGNKVATSGPDTYWKSGNPDNRGGIEGCMEIFRGRWNDYRCKYSFPFICEMVSA